MPLNNKNASGAEQVFRHRFTDLYEMRDALAGWQVEHHQLEPGPFSAEILQIGCGDAHLSYAAYNRKIDQAGDSPRGFTSFGIGHSDYGKVRLCGHDLGGSTIAIFKQDQEFEGNTPTDSFLYCLSVRDELLEQLSENAGIDARAVLSGSHNRSFDCDPRWVGAIRNRILQIIGCVNSDPEFLRSRKLTLELRHQLPLMVMTAFSLPNNETSKSTSRTRLIALDKVRNYINQNLDREIVIEELCGIAGVSWRTLNYAFREYFNVTPKRFVMAMRLNRVQRELYERGETMAIADIANYWGFWHMGKFAADYRRQFGELPSTTIKRVRGF